MWLAFSLALIKLLVLRSKIFNPLQENMIVTISYSTNNLQKCSFQWFWQSWKICHFFLILASASWEVSFFPIANLHFCSFHSLPILGTKSSFIKIIKPVSLNSLLTLWPKCFCLSFIVISIVTILSMNNNIKEINSKNTDIYTKATLLPAYGATISWILKRLFQFKMSE